MSDITRLKRFLQKNYPNIQAFNTRDMARDFILQVYNKDGIIVDYAPHWDYIEIFGLTDEEFENLIDSEGFLKTFTFKERKKRNENKN